MFSTEQVSTGYRSSKQIRVRSCACENNFCAQNIVNQKPIRLDVTFPKPLIFSSEFVRSEIDGKSAVIRKDANQTEELFRILTARLLFLEIAKKLLAL